MNIYSNSTKGHLIKGKFFPSPVLLLFGGNFLSVVSCVSFQKHLQPTQAYIFLNNFNYTNNTLILWLCWCLKMNWEVLTIFFYSGRVWVRLCFYFCKYLVESISKVIWAGSFLCQIFTNSFTNSLNFPQVYRTTQIFCFLLSPFYPHFQIQYHILSECPFPVLVPELAIYAMLFLFCSLSTFPEVYQFYYFISVNFCFIDIETMPSNARNLKFLYLLDIYFHYEIPIFITNITYHFIF